MLVRNLLMVSCVTVSITTTALCGGKQDDLQKPAEIHFSNMRQLTNGGENAEAYFSPDSSKLVFQSQREGHTCDQEYVMNIDGSNIKLVSTGGGRTTCGYWFQNGQRVLFSSTHATSRDCPPKPDFSKGYVWPVYSSYRIYSAKPDGTDLKPLFPRDLKKGEFPGYNAESVISPDGKKVVFTSDRGGDLDIWTMDINGKHAKQLTHELGYDGGPWWSPDGKRICYRAFHPANEVEKTDYLALLKEHLIRPTTLDLHIMNADGTGHRQITNDRAANIANFAPTWSHDGKSLVFCSNRADVKRRKFEIYKIGLVDNKIDRLTFGGEFDGFPCFSNDGKKIVWASNRHNSKPHETNLFIADWTD